MKMDISNTATRFLALSAIALTLSSAPSRADWAQVRPDGTVVTSALKAPGKGESGAPGEPDGVVVDDYAAQDTSDTYDGPSAASGRKTPVKRPRRSGRNIRHGTVPSIGRGRFDSGITILPGYSYGGYITPGYGVQGYGVPGYGYGVPGYGVPGYGYGAPTLGAGNVTIIQSPAYTAPGVQFPGFPPLPGTQPSATYVYPPPTIIQSYPTAPGYPAYGYPSHGYPSYGYPHGTTTHSYGGLSVSRGGVSVGIGGSRTTTLSTWGLGVYR